MPNAVERQIERDKSLERIEKKIDKILEVLSERKESQKTEKDARVKKK